MKVIAAQLATLLQTAQSRRNLRSLRAYLLFVLGLVCVYSVLFHLLMKAEGRDYSWITGLYWTLTVMSTLGFGDITFHSDLGRLFSMVVLLSGVLFFLMVLPFVFIQFFIAPWFEARTALRTPRALPQSTRGHVIITHYGPLALSLIQRLKYHGRPYCVLEPNVKAAMDLHDAGVHVVVGERDDVRTYQAVRAAHAALVVATGDDYVNTNTAFTVHETAPQVPIVSIARAPESLDILKRAGASHVLHMPELLGRALARRTLAGDARVSEIGRFGSLVVGEAPVTGTALIGKPLAESGIRESTGLTVVGVWERGAFATPTPTRQITASTVLVLVGSEAQFARFSELMGIADRPDAPVVILGGGGVARAVARALRERRVPYQIVEKDPAMIRDPATYVRGNAADLAVLKAARFDEAVAVVVTTNDDATNIYLTIYVRRLRPDVQIISRATLEHNISTLHRAGADFVMSYASMGANTVFNVLEQGDVVMLAEGLDLFRHPVPEALVGRSLAESKIRETSGCSVVALERLQETTINPPADLPLPADAELILIGTTEAERRFVRQFAPR